MKINSNNITTLGNDASGILMGDYSTNGTIFNNTIITTGNFSGGANSSFGGIFLDVGTATINVSSNTITMAGYNNAGIWIWDCSNHSIDSNIITTSGEWGDGIYLTDVQGINLTSNTINISGNASYGIYSLMSEDSSLLFYNNVITTSANHSDGIHFLSDNDNNISSNNITTEGYDSFGIYFNLSRNMSLANNIIKTGEADSYVLYLLTSSGQNFHNNIFNTSTSGSGVYINNSDLNYFNTTNSTGTNIIGKSHIGGNFWTNVQGTGYSDTCTNLNSDYFCDSVYNVLNNNNDNKDYLALTTHIGWNINGSIYNVNGVALNNSVVNITLWLMGQQGPTLFGSNSTTSNESGWFSFIVDANSSLMYKPVITHTNTTYDFVDYIGQSLPIFPYQEFSSLSSIDFYLKPAGTINITVINKTGDLIPFGYMIKDTKLGYEISMNSNTSSSGAVVYVPKDRNYSIMIWPVDGDSNHFVPVSFDWNNFTATENYNLNSLSNYSYTTKTLNKQFNVTESFSWVSGYIDKSDIVSWDNITIVPYLLEPSNMVGMTYGGLPYNASAWRGDGSTDSYNVTSGFYNITLPYCSTETVRYLLLAVAENDSTFYGSYRNLTINSSNEELNFTMHGFLGSNNTIINMSDSAGGNNHIVNISKQKFNLVNASNQTQVLSNVSAHIEILVDYSDYNCSEFTFIEDLSGSGSATISLPLLHMTNDEGVKEINVYSQTYAPKREGQKSGTDMQNVLNISMGVFNPTGIGSEYVYRADVNFTAYLSNATCDVPNPPASCVLTSFAPTQESGRTNMFPLVIGGGDLSVRITFNNISVHYVGVDLLASGPPNMEFNNQTDEGTSGSFSSAMKFGSNGPTIYDYVLVSIPYTEGSSSITGLNESSNINMSIPYLYGSNSWTNPIWDTSNNGTNATLLAGNYSHYLTHLSEWEILMGENTCETNVSEFNSTNPCYINKTSNRIWIMLPHFSGTEPSITGGVIVATEDDDDDDDNPSSVGGSGIIPFWIMTYVENNKNLDEKGLINKELKVKERIKFKINNETHYVGIIELTDTTSTINVSSDPQQDVFSVGDTKKFEVTGDDYYDLSVTLNSINTTSNKADITINSILEEIPEGAVPEEGEESSGEGGEAGTTVTEEKNLTWLWILISVVILVAVIVVILYKQKKTKRFSLFGY